VEDAPSTLASLFAKKVLIDCGMEPHVQSYLFVVPIYTWLGKSVGKYFFYFLFYV
jgi:hypothetical protein